MDAGRAAAQAYIDSLPEPRRSQMQHLHDVILDALPGIDVETVVYSGPMIGYGWYDYSNSKGPAGRWFSVGLANRKSYISLYAMGQEDGGYNFTDWDPARVYTWRVEWGPDGEDELARVLLDGVEVIRLPYNYGYLPNTHWIELGIEERKESIIGLVYRNFAVVRR